VFTARHRVRLGDVDPAGRLRLDAAARHLQDVSSDDTREARLPDDQSWVVRRTVIDMVAPPRFLEPLELATWCGGSGSRWAERRVSMVGGGGGRLEAAVLWVYVDAATLVPKKLDPTFLTLYGEAAGGRTVGSRLELPAPPPDGAGVETRPWPLRRTDLDVLGHVNNAAYWAPVEELLAERPDLLAGPRRAIVEFARPLAPGAAPELSVAHRADGFTAWLTVAGLVHAAASIHRSDAAHVTAW
jgi:acyl-ACP thioesterase